ncbi:MAG: dTMP kinase [Anaerolineaceae bacterium]|nr:dTMP kinase [Anaerolineaceae bacterium]
MLKPNICTGKLIVVEGIDGSGKSTQIDLIHKWLTEKGRSVFFSKWNSSPLVKSTTKLGKKEKAFTPTTFSLIQAADFADRWENQFLPMLKAGVIVLADRYAFTGFARDVARGVDRKWVHNLYSFAFQPDLILYFKVPLNEAIDRITSARSKLKYYEAGMDLNLSDKRITSFRIFQGKILKEYETMIDEFDFKVVDATRPVFKQQKEIRRLVNGVLKGWRGLPNPVSSAQNYARNQINKKRPSHVEVKNDSH